MRRKKNGDKTIPPAQQAGNLHRLVSIMRDRRGVNNKKQVKDTIRAWMQYGLKAGMSYDELKSLTMECIREHRFKSSK